jgi:AraC-like DNA-binding protein
MLNIGFRSYTSAVQSHAHSFFQIVLPSCGGLDLEVAGRCGCVDSGCAGVIGVGERHAFSSAAKTNRFLVLDIAITEQTVSNVRRLLNHLSSKPFAVLTPAAHYLIAYAETTADCSLPTMRVGTRASALWLELLLESLCDHSWLARDRPAKALARAKMFVDRFHDQPIRVRDVARASGLGASRLHEIFQERMGATPGAYLAEVRLRRALVLLANTDLSIADIAVHTGHADQTTLTRHVRRACGTTPAAYRRAAVSQRCETGEAAKSAGGIVKKG